MKRALRDLLSFALPIFFLFVTNSSANAQCPVVIDSIVTVDVTCSGANDGSISIYVSGGFADYNYQIFNPPAAPQFFTTSATTYTFTGLGSGSGNYQIIVVGEDGAGDNCDPVFDLAAVNDPPPFVMVVSTTNDTCPGGNVGTASLDVSGGVTPYTYSWPPFSETSDSISGLDGGTYSVIATDANGCSQSESFTIVSPPDWSGTLTGDDPSCNGGTDGSITSTGIAGGTPPYTFSWTGTAQTTENITGLGAGDYTLTVTDDLGCTEVFPTVTLGEPSPVFIAETHNDVSCNGDDDGSIDITVSGGSGGFSFLWIPGGSTGEDTTNLSPGIYEVFVTDAAGCEDSLEIEILEPSVLTLTSSSNDASCNTLCDGDATVTPSGGTPGYTYDWTPNVSSGPTATGLCAGDYDVIVTDANGCQDSASFTIVDNLLQVSVAATNISCNGTCDGTATSTVTGPNGPFTYNWQPSGGNGPTASNLCADTYTLTVTDATGCSVTETFDIIEPDPIVITLAVTDVSCEGLSDGEIDLTVSGGVGPYTYQWFPLGQTTEDIVGLPAGDYSVVVTDANGCTSSAITLGGSFNGGTLFLPDGNGDTYTTSISVTGFPANGTLASASDFQSVCLNMEHSYLGDLDIQLSCPNGTTVDLVQSIGVGVPGSIFLGDADDGAIGGVPGVGWTYCWTPTPTFGTMEAEANAGNTLPVTDGVALAPGDYASVESLGNFVGCPMNGDWTITVTDNFAIDDGFIFDWGVSFNGVGSNDSLATVNEPGPITSTSNVTDANCGSCDGEITVTPAGGSAPYTFLWNTGATSATISNLCAGVYNVIVTDANGCEETFFIPVDHVDGPTGANTTIVDASCFGVCDGEATVTGIGGAPPYTYQWVPGGFSTSNVTGLCAGTYNVQIQDSLNCIYTETVVVGEPAEIFIGQTVINSLCGQCTGEIDLSPISGQAPFSYDWSPSVPNTDTLATDLCAGVYNVTVTDATGCEVVVTSLVNDIPSPTLTMTGTDPLCNATCDGEAVVTPSGGTPPFTYLWDDAGAQTDSIATGLCVGLYTATLTDANGCVAVNQITLSEPDPIGLSLLIIDNGTCAGNCDGSITVIPSGGTIPFTYLWDDPAAQTTAQASNLCAGTYNVVVTDANGCTDNNSGTVNNPVGLTALATGTDVSCNGVCDGSAFATVTGGTPPFTYLWDDPAGQTSDTAVALCAGSYTVTVTDVNGCDFIAPVTISEPDPIVITFSNVIGLQCDGDCIGEATADVSGGTAPYTYSWDDALTQNTATADSLCASTYTVTVTDANGCSETASVTINGPNGFSSNIVSSTNTSCNGDCDGTAVVEGIGGTPPYTFLWNDPATTANDTVTGLCAGIYAVTVTDVNGCIATASVVIDEPDLLDATTTADDVSCFGECDGAATAFTLGGAFPYTYQWNDPANQTTLTAVGLCPGNYEVEITDANGCIAIAPVTIFEPTEITLDTTIVNATCGLCNGEITAIPDGGVPGYTYLWGNGETTATITGLCPGVYTVDVTDAIGCTVNFDIAVSNDGGPTSATVAVTDATCFGVCDGEATVTPVGGTAPYTYLWVPGGQATSTVSGLCAGSYNVQIVDAEGCIFTQLVTVNEPAEIVSNANTTQATCGQCDGEIVLAPTGGDGGPYTYSWAPAVSVNETATGLCAGIYTVTIRDGSGCQTIETIPISNIDGPTVTASSTDATCDSDCDGTGTITITGGIPPYTILWDDPLAQTDPTATGLCAGSYNVTVTDDNGCQSVAQITIEDPDPISLSLQLVVDATCAGVCDGSATVVASGGTLPFTYDWAPSGGTSNTALGLCAGTYTVTVTDANGCQTQQVVVVDELQPQITIDATITDASCGICNGEITVVPDGGVPTYDFLWGNGETTPTISNLCAAVYTVDVTDALGCSVNFDIPVSNTGGPTSATVVQTDASCFGICDGEATVTPDDGTPPFTYLWVPGGQTTSNVTGLCAGTYNVQILDSLGCIYTETVVINEPAEIVSNSLVTQASCGQCNGEIVLTPTGGDGGPYTYSWSPAVSTTEIATSLCAGIYTVTISDGNGCETIETIPISNLDGPTLTATGTDASCDGVCDGAGTVVITGGTPPYTILWDDPLAQTDPSATGLCEGTYNVTVTDDNGCQTVAQVVISEPDPISISVPFVQDASCPGVCDGSATVVASGGILPYTYNWVPTGSTGSTESGLCAGSYTVIVTDANGCTEQVTIVVNEPDPIVIDTNTLDASCNGLCDGEAYALATGGSGGFTYQWNDLASTASDTVTGLCAGTYQVVVTDITGCTDSTTVTINEPDSISINITVEGASCAGDCDGSAIAVAIGGNAPYTYQWNDPSSTLNDTVSGLCAGIYSLVVTDSLGCTQTATAVIDEPLPLALTDSATNITCGGSCDGIAGVLVTGGTPVYTYQWDDPNNSTTPFVTGLCAGTYQVVVTDANGCADSTSVTIIEPPVLDITVAVQNPSCGGVCDGEATVTINGGTPGYGILWLPGLEITPTISNLCAGQYTVIVVDASGCSDTAVVDLTEPPLLEAEITSVTQVLCATGCAGEATVTGTGGTPPFTYQWNDPASQTTQTAIDLCVGIWSVTITDDIGCTATATTVITDSAALVASIPISTQVTCAGECDGTATVFANGGVGPYTYSWDDPFSQATQTATGLCAGTYTVTVTDSQNPGCVTQATVTIIQPLELTATASAIDVTCGTDCDGTALAIPLGGTPPYQFSWNDPASQTSIEATNLCVGTYTVTITDANGCTAQASVTVDGPSSIVSNATTTASTCSNLADGSIDLTVVGGSPGYDFNWVPGNIDTEDLTNVEFGTYTVTITDQDGCSITADYSVGTLVDINSEPGLNDTVCIGTPIQLIGSGGGDYLWSPAESLSDATIADPVATPLDTTTYLLTVTIGNCVDVDSLTIYTYGVPPVDGGNDVQIPTGGSIGLNANGAVTGWLYSWEPAEFLDNPEVTNPTAMPEETTMFYVTVTDENGCSATDSILVEVTPGIDFPDGITPNGDGINDTWRIDNIDLFDDAIVEVYNRWGQALFISAPGYPVPWDGKYKGKDLPVGTYYYVIHSANFEEPFTGPITIVR